MDRYKEALAKARAGKSLEEIFPEMKESEDERDERIRKAIVHLLTVASESYLIDATGFKKEQFLSYLEKRKESLHIEKTCKDNGDSFTDNVIEVRSFQRGIEEGRRLEREKQKERSIPLEESIKAIPPINYDIEASAYNYADQFADKGTNYIEIRDAYKAGAYYMELKQKEQKPAEWSEEDEKIRQSIIKYIEFERNYTFATTGKVIGKYNEQITWLKSLPQRFNLRPKQEWGEKDNIMLENTILCLKEYCLTDEISWLNSLRPSWKPSEEQLRFLLAVINEPNNAGSESCHLVLKELYEQLKTL